jgi:glucose uptake protein GlcU
MLINYLDNRIKSLNREQIDAYSRYAHALSVSSAIGTFGLFFTDDELLGVILKFSFSFLVTIILFILGIYILREKNDD